MFKMILVKRKLLKWKLFETSETTMTYFVLSFFYQFIFIVDIHFKLTLVCEKHHINTGFYFMFMDKFIEMKMKFIHKKSEFFGWSLIFTCRIKNLHSLT